MTSYATHDERPHTGYSYRAPVSSHGPPPSEHEQPSSPGRHPAPQAYRKSGQPHHSPYQTTHEIPPSHSHAYPPPVTPLSGSTYPPQPPQSYFGVSQTPVEHLTSPPPTSTGRPTSEHYTQDGIPLVPVGISGGKMFKCRGYGDCDKVFTRSEHLARHVRKHTGERPFPCHCGKAFSRLDNLRQHAATVHSDQIALNEAMLNSLAPVHAALSQRAGREQKKRGEIVEVPKNAVERPRHSEIFRNKDSPGSPGGQSPYLPYAQDDQQWAVQPAQHRPRVADIHDYPYAPVEPQYHHTPGDPGPSRRPGSSDVQYTPLQTPYYPESTRPPTAPGTSSSGESMSHLPYPYRPMSSDGRELPIPQHYGEAETPVSIRPPQSPMYPPAVPPHANWSSPPHHPAYPPHEQSPYLASGENYRYPPEHYTPQPPGSAGSNYSYPQSGGYYPPPGYGPAAQPPPPHPYPAPPSFNHGPPDSPFPYPPSGHGQDHYYAPSYDHRKRRADDQSEEARKHARTSTANQHHLAEPLTVVSTPRNQQQDDDTLWLPPTTERRSSLAISALLGSPQQPARSRPQTASHDAQHGVYGTTSAAISHPMPNYPPVPYPSQPALHGPGSDDPGPGFGPPMDEVPRMMDGQGGGERTKIEESMGQKAKALLGDGR